MVQMIQTTFIHQVVIMLVSDMVQMIRTTFIHLVVIVLGSDMVQMIQTTFIHLTEIKSSTLLEYCWWEDRAHTIWKKE